MQWHLKKYQAQARPFISGAVLAGNLIYLSGIAGTGHGTDSRAAGGFEEQLAHSLDNVRQALDEAGSNLSDLVKLFIMITKEEDYQRLGQALEAWFGKYAPSLLTEPPVITVIPVKALGQPGSVVEVDAHAVTHPDDPDCEVKRYPKENRRPGTLPSAELVTVGNLVYLPAYCGASPRTGKIETNVFEEQMDIAFDKIMKALDRAGSSASNLVKTLHMQAGMENMLVMGKDPNVSGNPASDRLWRRELEHFDMYAPYLMEEFPASTFLKLPVLPLPGAQVQLDYIGVLNRYRKGWEVRNYPLYLGRRGFPKHAGEIKKFYSNTVVIGNIINISGQTATDPFTAKIESDNFEDQLHVALDGLRSSLEETGSSLEHLVKTYVLLPDPGDYDTYRNIERDYFRKYAPALVDEPPASTVIYPLSLASVKMKIEIDAIGLIPQLP